MLHEVTVSLPGEEVVVPEWTPAWCALGVLHVLGLVVEHGELLIHVAEVAVVLMGS